MRLDSDGKYTSVSRSARLRRQYASRSSAMPVSRCPSPATNSWLNDGITERAVEPSVSGCTGTSRHPSTASPSSSASSSIRLRVLATSSSSPGRKAVPTA